MENNPLLSICIPTYNRAGHLKNCLDDIICQFADKKVQDLVEIVISDNASQDNTETLVKEYQNKHSNIKYFRNETNLGVDKNIINSVVKATGKYCWSIGDDDLIQNGSLKFIVNFLSQNNVALLTVNLNPFIDMEKSLKEDNNINEKFITYYDSPEEFYRKGCCQGILGIFIFDRDLYLKVDRTNYEEFWSYYEIILKMLPSSGLKLAYLSYPVIFTGQDYKWNKNGTILFTTIHVIGLFNKLRTFGYEKDFLDEEISKCAKSLPMILITAKIADLKCSFANFRLVCKYLYKYPSRLLVAVLIFFIPNSLFKALKSIKNKLKKNDNQRA